MVFTIAGNYTHRSAVMRSMETLRWFLATNQKMKILLNTFRNLIKFMQIATKKRNLCRHAKLEILENCWDKLIG